MQIQLNLLGKWVGCVTLGHTPTHPRMHTHTIINIFKKMKLIDLGISPFTNLVLLDDLAEDNCGQKFSVLRVPGIMWIESIPSIIV